MQDWNSPRQVAPSDQPSCSPELSAIPGELLTSSRTLILDAAHQLGSVRELQLVSLLLGGEHPDVGVTLEGERGLDGTDLPCLRGRNVRDDLRSQSRYNYNSLSASLLPL